MRAVTRASLAALTRVRHVEYFYDHARIEHMLFDGVLTPVHGALQPDLSCPGLGLAFKHADAARYAVWSRANQKDVEGDHGIYTDDKATR